MRRYIIFYGLLAFALLMLFQLSSMWLFTSGTSREWLLAIVAVVSAGFGIFFTKGKKEVITENTSGKEESLTPYADSGLTEREYEVLCLINQGYSNKEVGEKLFISENTVKTHVSNLLVKLNAKRRTQAVKNAKELKII